MRSSRDRVSRLLCLFVVGACLGAAAPIRAEKPTGGEGAGLVPGPGELGGGRRWRGSTATPIPHGNDGLELVPRLSPTAYAAFRALQASGARDLATALRAEQPAQHYWGRGVRREIAHYRDALAAMPAGGLAEELRSEAGLRHESRALVRVMALLGVTNRVSPDHRFDRSAGATAQEHRLLEPFARTLFDGLTVAERLKLVIRVASQHPEGDDGRRAVGLAKVLKLRPQTIEAELKRAERVAIAELEVARAAYVSAPESAEARATLSAAAQRLGDRAGEAERVCRALLQSGTISGVRRQSVERALLGHVQLSQGAGGLVSILDFRTYRGRVGPADMASQAAEVYAELETRFAVAGVRR